MTSAGNMPLDDKGCLELAVRDGLGCLAAALAGRGRIVPARQARLRVHADVRPHLKVPSDGYVIPGSEELIRGSLEVV